MSATNSTRKPDRSKPAKPRPDFPLFAHATGRWAKKVRGRMHYFGPWEDPEGAEALWERQKVDLLRGLTPALTPDALTVFTLCAKFLAFKKGEREAGKLSPHTFLGYGEICKRMVKALGKNRLVAELRPDDFARLRANMEKTWGPVRVKAETVRCRTVFNWAEKNGIIPRKPIYGEGFKVPSARVLRLHKAAKGKKLFTPEEIRRLLDAATPPLRAMILLGINAGFGNADCGHLPLSALDLDRGWIDFPRPKTGVARRCPLWPETVAALREVVRTRGEPKSGAAAGLVFITKYGQSWAKDIPGSPITAEFKKLAKRTKIEGRGFYALRHVFQTIGDGARDPLATRHIMGHADQDVSAFYREEVPDDRLRAVADHVRAWLFGCP